MSRSLIGVPFFFVVACASPSPSTEVPTAQQDEAALRQPSEVMVVNDASDPVNTRSVGTTAVSGSVQASQAGAWTVAVTNTANVRAEQSGSWNVGVTGGTVAATQAGAWNVNVTSAEPVALAMGASVAVNSLPPVTLAGTPTVAVTGSVTVANSTPVPVRSADGAPWAFSHYVVVNDGTSGNSQNVYTVPVGKRLIVESVSSAYTTGGSVAPIWFSIDTHTGGTYVSNFFPYGPLATGGTHSHSVGSQQTKLYADPGTQVSVSIMRAGSAVHATVFVTMHGRLVDAI